MGIGTNAGSQPELADRPFKNGGISFFLYS